MKEIRFYWVKAIEFDSSRRGTKLDKDWYKNQSELKEEKGKMLSMYAEYDI